MRGQIGERPVLRSRLHTSHKNRLGRLCRAVALPQPDARHPGLAGVRGQIGEQPVPGRVHTHPIKTASGGCAALPPSDARHRGPAPLLPPLMVKQPDGTIGPPKKKRNLRTGCAPKIFCCCETCQRHNVTNLRNIG